MSESSNVSANTKIESVPDLLGRLEDSNATVRSQAASALGALCDQENIAQAVGPLLRVLSRDSDKGVRLWAANSVVRISYFTQSELRHKAPAALVPTFKAAIPTLCRLVNDPDPTVQQSMFSVLTYMGAAAAESVPTLSRFLESKDPELRRSAYNILRWMGTPEAKKASEDYKKI